MENVDGDEADEGDPVQLLQQLGVGTTVEDEDKKTRCPNFQRFSGSKLGPEGVSPCE